MARPASTAGTQRSLSGASPARRDRKSTRLNSSHSQISYAVFCLKKKRDRAEIVREPARTVDLRLAGGGPALLGQSGVGVGRRDLGHVGAVGDADRNLGGARVVGADVDDRQRVADGLVRVLGLDRAVPLARLRRGVVHVYDAGSRAP